jgi:hypothetical protein
MSIDPSPRDFKSEFAGRTVQFVGMFGNADGPTGKVWRVTSRGVWVTLPDGSRQQWHPEDIRTTQTQQVTIKENQS